MRRLAGGLLALAAVVLCALTADSQEPPQGKKKDGPPRPRRGGPPRFELGKVLPPFAREALELTKEQEDQLAQLEKEVKERLSKILTAEQQKKLETLRPLGPGGPGGPPGKGERPERPKDPDRPDKNQPRQEAAASGGIQWFATWESGLREAQRTGRPILLVSAAPHCAGVPGTW
jgi:hypothetical protein